jgi:aspartate ammonia-lyase
MTSKGGPRTENDYLGEMEIPAGAYYGIQTARAIGNFPVSGLREDPVFTAGYVTLKKAAALANMGSWDG